MKRQWIPKTVSKSRMQTEVLQINLHMAVVRYFVTCGKVMDILLKWFTRIWAAQKGLQAVSISDLCIHYLFAKGLSFKIKTDGAFEKY